MFSSGFYKSAVYAANKLLIKIKTNLTISTLFSGKQVAGRELFDFQRQKARYAERKTYKSQPRQRNENHGNTKRTLYNPHRAQKQRHQRINGKTADYYADDG